jgi:phosphoribosylformylglycinamidine synthase subunit PurL
VGAVPLAITNCLNFGNPERGDIAWQFSRVIEGMAEACEAFASPVISGNVSFYNESFGQAIYPTPVVGMLGLLDDVDSHCTVGFVAEGDIVMLIGGAVPALDGSEYQKRWFGGAAGRIQDVDLRAEVVLQGALRQAIADGMVRSAHDCSDGGLAVALAECCLSGGIGARAGLDAVPGSIPGRHDLTLFGEAPSLVVVSVEPPLSGAFQKLCGGAGVPCGVLGTVGGDALGITVGGEQMEVPLAALQLAYGGSLERALAE